MITAEAFFKTKKCRVFSNGEVKDITISDILEFIKLHVEQALKTASENGQAKYDNVFEVYVSEVDKDSILNSYPLTNIK